MASLCEDELESLRRRLSEAEQALRALASGQVDAVAHETAATPILLHAAQEQLRRSERLFRAVFDGALDAMLLADDRGTFVDANPAACELFGLPKDELLGCQLSRFSASGYDYESAWRAVLEVGQTRGQFPLRRSDGTLRQLEFTATARLLPGLHLFVLRDVTEKERAAAALKASEARFRAVVEKSLGAFSLSGADGTRMYVSPPVARLLGYEPEELIGQPRFDRIHPDDKERSDRITRAVLERPGESVTAEFRAQHRNGAYVWLEATLTNLLADPAVEALVAYFRDVTDRKNAEEALRESRYLLEQAQALAQVGSWTVGSTPDEPIVCSNECYRIFGLPRDHTITLDGFFAQVHPDDLPRVKEALRLAEQGLRPYEAEYRIYRPSGEQRWVRACGHIHRAMPGGPGKMIGVVQDVTEQHRSLEELRVSELRYRRIIETTSEGVWTIDRDFKTTFMNRRMCEMLGYGSQETMGRSVFDFMDEEAWRRALDVRDPHQRDVRDHAEFRLRRKDGSDLWVSIESNPLFDAAGNFEGFLGMLSDISERRRAEEARNRLAAIVESSEDSIISKDVSGVIVSWNGGAQRLFGYTAEEALGKNISFLYPPDREHQERRVHDEVFAGATIHAYETVRLRKDGSPVPLSLSLSPVRDANGRVTGVAGIGRDLTEQKRAEAALRRSEDQLRQAQKMDAIGGLAGGIAHDFNNLLSVVVGYSALMLDALPGDAPYRAELEEVRSAGDRAVALTRQLLAFSRRQVLQPVVLDLNQVLLGFERMFRRLIGADIELVLLPCIALGHVAADPSQIEQVLMNLVVNARDAMPQGGTLTIETANETMSDVEAAQHVDVRPGPYVVLKVTDVGHGMSETTKRRIFEPFFTTKEKGKGTGLGLSTVFGIVRQSGGHITVASDLGRGTTFRVFLPQCERPIDRSSVSLDVVDLRGSETVLVVEDDDRVRELTRTVLRRSGYHVLEAQNAGEALLISEQHAGTIHLLLTDVIMPRVSGHALAERLSRSRPDMKVLFMSGYAEDPEGLQAVLTGGAAFFAKPVVPAALQRKVRQVLDT